VFRDFCGVAVRRVFIVVALVLVVTVGYRSYADPQTGTGALTLPQPAPNPGNPAEPFEALGVHGEPFEVSDRGVRVLTFWSALNRGAAESRPQLEKLSREYEDTPVEFAAIYTGSVPAAEEDAPYNVIRDSSGRLASLYNVKRVPRLFVVVDGRIALVQNGHHEDNEKELRQTLDEVLEERAEPGD
jgi:hypothetical protein